MRRFLVPLFFLLISICYLATLPHYGLTWDFHHQFFSGLKFFHIPFIGWYVDHIPFGIPDPRVMTELPFGRFISILPTGSYLLFTKILNLLPLDAATHLPNIVIGIAGLFLLYQFLKTTTTKTTALIALTFLSLTPRYIADVHNNTKDLPSAVAFTASIISIWYLVQKRTLGSLLIAGLCFAIAFNTKVNALFIPVIFVVWWSILALTKKIAGQKLHLHPSLLFYIPVAISFALTLWFILFENPIETLLYLPRFFQDNTQNIEVLFFGSWYCSAINVPWYYPLGYLSVVTPLPILISFLVGFVVCVKQVFQKKSLPSLLLLWFFVPLVRYVIPTIGVIDGIRHFEEVVFPLTAIAALGASTILMSLKKRFPAWVKTGIIICTVVILILPNILLHPYQITYFNGLVGWTPGALGRFDLDYWGGSQKQAVEWLNGRAEKDAVVSIIMAPDVAARYLREDLLERVNTVDYTQADYVIILNRTSFFYRYYMVNDYILTHTPIHTITTMNTPLVFIFDNRNPATQKQNQWWTGTEDPCMRMK